MAPRRGGHRATNATRLAGALAAATTLHRTQPRTYQIDGHMSTLSGMHTALVAAATAASMTSIGRHAQKAPILFARMDCHGVGEDLNHAIRMLAIALSESRQIVVLPPAREDRYVPTQCALPRSVKLSYEQPWHWLAGQSFSTSSILVPSSCQTALYQRQPIAMEAVAQSSSGNATRVLLQRGERCCLGRCGQTTCGART